MKAKISEGFIKLARFWDELTDEEKSNFPIKKGKHINPDLIRLYEETKGENWKCQP